MTSTENVILNSIKKRVKYCQENEFDKYAILEYVDGIINKARKSSICTDDLLRHLFDVRQKVLIGKEI